MAGFDYTKQKAMHVPGGVIEMGLCPTAFTTAATTVSVPTTLTNVLAGLGVCVTGKQAAIATTGAVAGSVTFTRPSGGTSGDTLQYIIVGF